MAYKYGAQSVNTQILAEAMLHHGVLTASSLPRALKSAIRRRVVAGDFAQPHRGIYVVPDLADEWTDVLVTLARSEYLAVSHLLAAALFGWDGLDRPGPGVFESPSIVAPWSHRADLVPYRHRDLARADLTIRDGIRVTSPRWTLEHLHKSPGVTCDIVEWATESALRTQQATEDDLWKVPALREVLERRGRGSPPTESFLETLAVQKVIRRGNLPLLGRQVNVYAHGNWQARVDFLFHGSTVLEVDGSHHRSAAQKQEDDIRDMKLQSVGLQVARAGWEQVDRRPVSLAARLRRLIAEGKPDLPFDGGAVHI